MVTAGWHSMSSLNNINGFVWKQYKFVKVLTWIYDKKNPYNIFIYTSVTIHRPWFESQHGWFFEKLYSWYYLDDVSGVRHKRKLT